MVVSHLPMLCRSGFIRVVQKEEPLTIKIGEFLLKTVGTKLERFGAIVL